MTLQQNTLAIRAVWYVGQPWLCVSLESTARSLIPQHSSSSGPPLKVLWDGLFLEQSCIRAVSVLLMQRLAQAQVSCLCCPEALPCQKKQGRKKEGMKGWRGSWVFSMSAVVCASIFSPGRFEMRQSLHPGFSLLTPLHMILNVSSLIIKSTLLSLWPSSL